MPTSSQSRQDAQRISFRFDFVIRVILYILIFWIPYSPAVIESCVVVALLIWLIKRTVLRVFRNRYDPLTFRGFFLGFAPPPNILNQSIGIFIGACLLSVISSTFWQQAFQGFITKTLEWFVIYFLIIETFQKKRHIIIAISLFMFSSFAVCLDGVLQFYLLHKDIFLGRPLIEGGATASFKHYNNLGAYLTFVVLNASALLFFNGRILYRMLFGGYFLLAGWAVVLTFSRGAWVGVISGIIFLVLFLKKKLIVGIIFILCIFLMCFYLFFPIEQAKKFRMDVMNIKETVYQRAELWREGLVMVKDKPFFGHGLNTFMNLFQAYRLNPDFPPTYAHNCYLQMTAEIGLVGLASFLYLLWNFFYGVISNLALYGPKRDFLQLGILGFLGGTFAFLVHCFFETSLYSLQLVGLLWVMVAFIISIDKILISEINRDIRRA